jgi:DNA-binding NarL/FixJ family response regulator
VHWIFGISFFKACIRRAGQLYKARILLADDHPRFPEVAEHFLEPEFEIVGKVADGQSLFDEAMRLNPDVVVTDISMPVLNGIEAVDKLKESGCKSQIVFLTVHTGSDFVHRCLSTGAVGYVLKSRIATELVPAVREALIGRIFVSKNVRATT